MINILKDIDDNLSEDDISEFCLFYGVEEVWFDGNYNYIYNHNEKYSRNIIERVKYESNPTEFYKLLEVIFTLNIKTTYGYRQNTVYSKKILLQKTQKAIEYSNIDVSLQVKDNDIFLYPKGEKYLDDNLVNILLNFLNQKSQNHFIEALKFYQDKKPIKSAESLRRTLEEFLREKLDPKKGLKENIKSIESVLKAQGTNSQVAKIIGHIFNYLDTYFNDNSKHNDGNIKEEENEFLIYQIGLLLRYLYQTIKTKKKL